MLKKISLFIKSLVLCLFLSVGAAHASAPVNVSSIGMAVVNGISDVAVAFVDDSMQARGFRGFGRANKGFSMNFGGKGKSAANTNATKNNTATQSNAAKGAAAANPAVRAGLFGFLGGLGMMGMMMLGVGIFGGGFFLYVLAMMLIPVISSFFANKQKMQNQEIPTSSYSTNDLFKKPVDEEEKGSRRF